MWTILAVLGAALVLVLVIAALRPAEFRISRSLEIGAPAQTVFALIEDFSQWPRWSPWEKLDLGLSRTLSSNPRGVGATYGWNGNGKVGEGEMRITATRPDNLVAIEIRFKRPMKAENDVNFRLELSSHGTLVEWSMGGSQPFMGKLMGLFMNMDRMVGSQFEEGLSNLKSIAEAEPEPAEQEPAKPKPTARKSRRR